MIYCLFVGPFYTVFIQANKSIAFLSNAISGLLAHTSIGRKKQFRTIWKHIEWNKQEIFTELLNSVGGNALQVTQVT